MAAQEQELPMMWPPREPRRHRQSDGPDTGLLTGSDNMAGGCKWLCRADHVLPGTGHHVRQSGRSNHVRTAFQFSLLPRNGHQWPVG